LAYGILLHSGKVEFVLMANSCGSKVIEVIKLHLTGAIRLISIMLRNNNYVNGIKIMFMKNSDLDRSVLCYPNVCCCPFVENAEVYNTKTIPLEDNVNLISDTFG
jgi:hypothetical protein